MAMPDFQRSHVELRAAAILALDGEMR